MTSGWKVAGNDYFADQISYGDSWKQFGDQVDQVPDQWKSLLGSAMDTVSSVAKL